MQLLFNLAHCAHQAKINNNKSSIGHISKGHKQFIDPETFFDSFNNKPVGLNF